MRESVTDQLKRIISEASTTNQLWTRAGVCCEQALDRT
jgi:hypothetical protein